MRYIGWEWVFPPPDWVGSDQDSQKEEKPTKDVEYGMNPFLAELFNTNGYAERVAEVKEAVETLLSVAEEEGIDLSGLSEDELVELAVQFSLEDDEQDLDEYSPEELEDPKYTGPEAAEAAWLGLYMGRAFEDAQKKLELTNDPDSSFVFKSMHGKKDPWRNG